MTEQSNPRTPGHFIRALLDEHGWTQETLAIVLGIDQSTVSKLTRDTRRVSAEMAVGLGEVFSVDAERFLELQKAFDLHKARFSAPPDPGRHIRAHLFGKLPIREMMQRGWISVSNVAEVQRVEVELARFFGVDSPEEIEILPHAPKKTDVATAVTPAQLAWLYRVRQLAEEILSPPYTSKAGVGAVKKLRGLLSAPEMAAEVPRVLADAGIRFVIVESLSSAKIDGVCFWLDETSPVIGLSLRYDRIDNFWFCLRHELEHVLKGQGKAAVMLDTELEGDRAGTGIDLPEEERMANEAAASFCVPADKMQMFIVRKDPLFKDRDLTGFARTLGIHPGLVAGQLQHRTGRYDRFRKHLVKIRRAATSTAMVDGWGDVAPV